MVVEDAQYRSAIQLAQVSLPPFNRRPSRPTNVPTLRESLRSAFLCSAAKDRQFLLMYYADGLTLREIGCVLSISESAASLRHEALIADFAKRQERV